MATNKSESIHVRLTEADKEALEEIAISLDRPAAQIAREAVKEKIAALKEQVQEAAVQ